MGPLRPLTSDAVGRCRHGDALPRVSRRTCVFSMDAGTGLGGPRVII